MVNGRPATRVGKHRLFVLLARAWADAGFPVMRFDYRGTGDCEGELPTLEGTSEDIASAVDAFAANMPGLQQVVLWGLCGGAADALLYAPQDPRVMGAILVNPWTYDARVRSLVSLRHFAARYFRRLLSFDRPIGRAGNKIEGVNAVWTASSREPELTPAGDLSGMWGTETAVKAYRSYRSPDMSRRLAGSLEKFKGKVLMILGGGDVGARTFKVTTSMSLQWRRLLSASRVRLLELPEANHSLRRPQWRQQAAAWTIEWLKEL